MIEILIRLIILAWPFGQLLLLSPLTSSVRLHLLDILSFGIVIFVLIYKKDRQKLTHLLEFKALILFLLISIFSFLINSRSIVSLLYMCRLIVYLILLIKVTNTSLTKYRKYINLSVGLFILLSFVQYLFIPDTRNLRLLGYDDHYYRLIGAFLDPNYTGAVLSIISLYLVNQKKNVLKLLSIIPLVGLMLTYSRGSYLAFLVGLFLLILLKLPKKALLIIPLFILLLIVIPKPFGEGGNLLRTFSIESRLNSINTGISLIKAKPVFGWGYDRAKNISSSVIPYLSGGIDNSFIFIAVNTGIFGLVAFLWFLKSLIQKTDPAGLAMISVILIHSFFNNTLLYPWILVSLGVLLSVSRVKAKTSH